MKMIEDLLATFMRHHRPWSQLEIIFWLSLGVVLLITVVILIHKKKISLIQGIFMLVMLVYVAMVFQTTVFTRSAQDRGWKLEPFWSWKLALEGNVFYQEEVFLNFLLLLPAGFCLPFCAGRFLKWRTIFLWGFGLSLLIETLQLVLQRGLFETDDLIGNTIGFMIGALIPWTIQWIRHGRKRKPAAV